jgi:hypothetical protein
MLRRRLESPTMNRTKITSLAATALFVGIGLAACSSAPAPTAPAATTASAAAPATTAPAAPSTPAMTTAQQQAVDSAQSYLAEGEGFSEYGLTRQLTSSSGAGFSQADAAFAISYLKPDWDAQAVESAKGYVQMGGFSAASLTQQLTSTDGGGFTQAQAEYAVAKVGL